MRSLPHRSSPRGRVLAGGRAIKTPFGTFFAPNITPDPETGIGAWSIADFVRAMTEGIAPDGTTYYPVFPYTSYTKMTRRDLEDLKAYLDTVSPVRRPNRAHDLKWPFGWRFVLGPWRLLYFNAGTFEPDPDRSGEWNRGAYLVAALGHCAECHTPRNLLGGPKSDMALAGSRDGPEGELAPNITPEEETGIGGWSMRSLVSFLRRGFKPDGDDVQGSMALVIEHGLRYLDEADLEAIVTYLFTLPPIHNRLEPKKAPAPDPWAE